MSEDGGTARKKRLENLLDILIHSNLQDEQKYLEGDLADRKGIIEEVLSLLALEPLSTLNCSSLINLIQSGKLSRYYVYLALAAHQDVNVFQTIVIEDIKISIREKRRVVEYLLDNKENLVLELFLLTIINGEDWLSYLVELVANSFSLESCLGKLETLLEYSPLTRIWELVLLHLLQKKGSNELICRAVLHIKDQDKTDQALVALSCYLLHRLTLLSWLEGNTVGVRPVTESRTAPLSALRLLHQSCNLSNLDWEQTHSYLVESVQSGEVSTWEPPVFDAVIAVISTVEAVQLASLSRSSDPIPFLSVEQHYEDNIVSRLSKIRKIVDQLQPLTLRTEVLENIFSLLFIGQEDFLDEEADRLYESGTEEEDGNAGKKTLHKATLTDVSVIARTLRRKRSSVHDHKTGKTAPPRKQGFLCGPNITRDLLLLLERSVQEASETFYSSLNAESVEWDAPSLISVEELQTRIRQLSKYVVDALWRLRVVSSPGLLGSEGRYVIESSTSYDPQADWTYADPSQIESESDDESTVKIPPKAPAKSKKSDAEKSSSSSSSVLPPGQSGKTSGKTRRRSQSGPSFLPDNTATIQRMLCSPASLTNQCLLRGEFEKAENVVQVFGLAETMSGAEVRFLENYRRLHRIHGTPSFGIERKPFSSSQNTTLQAVQRAASAGVQALQINYEVDQLLTGVLPEVPYVEEICGGSPKQHAIAVVAADVTLTLAKNAQQARSFISLAAQRNPELAKLHSSSHSLESAAYCFIPFLRSLLQVTETSEEGSPLALLQRWDLDEYSVRTIRDHMQFGESLNSALAEWYSNQDDSAFSKLVQAASLVGSLKGSEAGKFAYFQELQNYLQLLQKIFTVEAPLDVTGVSQSQYTALLQYSPFDIFWSLFEQGVPMQKLELAAGNLGLCLPFVLSFRLIPSPPAIRLPSGNKAVVLNDGTWPTAARKPSLVASSLLEGVLHELLLQWKELQLVNGRECRNLPVSIANSSRLEAVLADTKELAVIDLDLLQKGEETVAFFCNVCNLLMLHALLHTQINNGDTSALTSLNTSQRMSFQSTLFYRVGQLGFISLWQILQLTMGYEVVSVPSSRIADILMKRKFNFEARDPRLILAIASGRPTSPVVQVMRARRLNEQLEGAVREYVRFWTRLQQNKLQVPSLTERYLKFSGLPLSHLLKLYDPQASISDELELNVLPEGTSDPVYVLSYGTTNKWPDIKEQLVESKPDLSDAQLSNLLSYLEDHCWPVALLVRLICGTDSQEIQDDSRAVLQRLLKMPDVLERASLLQVSAGVAAIHACVPNSTLWNSLRVFIENGEWKKVCDLLSVLPTYQLQEDASLRALRDLALLELITEGPSSSNPTPWRQCYHLSSAELRARCALTCASSWPGDECWEILSQLAQEPSLEDFPHLQTEVTQLLAKVQVCQEVLMKVPAVRWNTWKDVYDCGETDPLMLLESIKVPALCLQWLLLFPLLSIPKTDIDRIVRLLLQVDTCRLPILEQVLRKLPLGCTAHTLVKFLPNVTSVTLARFLLRFLDSTCRNVLSSSDLEVLQLSLLGLQMIEVLPSSEQEECLRLMTLPHLLLEQMLMNMRLEAVSCMLAEVRENLSKLSPGSPLSSSSVDLLLRTYAEKALDFRVAVAYSDHSDMSCSISSYTSSKGREFVMPFNVPSKSDWIPNEKAAVCMSCGDVTFSMFNRRHHCRRCGRVVCAACSANRMQVEGYGFLKVRVCGDCFVQSTRAQGQPSIESASAKFETHKLGSTACSTESVWQLTPLQNVNNTVREEFAYEHAPSVSLCLSILQLHSQHPACPSFLLDCCEKILELLKPIAPSVPNPEVDYALVIQMCGSLVVAAKVKCAQWGYSSGVVDCDRLFSQIDLFRLLVDHECAGLIMHEVKAAKGGSSLVYCAQDLRQLRNRLLKDELWELALEVSTKGGLGRNSVWAAWGKGCLQAGCWEKAREKFAHCFVMSPGSSRPTKDSPLLIEILQILENLPKGSLLQQVSSKSLKSESSKQKMGTAIGKGSRQNAETVILSLASLQDIAQGKFQQVTQTSSGAGIEFQIYTECCYYLRTYGSHALYLHFLLRHRDVDKALRHVRDNVLDAQAFFEWLYIPCLKSGLITSLHASMMNIDPSLNDWKEYLRGVCAILERKRMLHVLYEIQQWAGDHVRAAMTCIRFFSKEATSYSELVGRLKHLKHAQAHLDAALAEVSAVQGQSSQSFPKEMINISNQAIPLLLSAGELRRHQTTIWRQIELTKYLANCEASGKAVLDVSDPPIPAGSALPTLFSCAAEREQLAVLAILCGTDVEEGFGIAIRIVGDFKMNAPVMYKRVAVGLVRQQRPLDVLKLVECIRSSGEEDMDRVNDDVLLASVEADGNLTPAQAEMLIKNITSNEVKITAYIASRLLKSAYLLAVKCDRLEDIEAVLVEAERLGQTAIKNICLKRLGRS